MYKYFLCAHYEPGTMVGMRVYYDIMLKKADLSLGYILLEKTETNKQKLNLNKYIK